MKRLKSIEFWVGILILTGLGFLAFVLFAGLGYLIALVFIIHSWWAIVLGTLGGMVAVFLSLLTLHEKRKEKG